MIKKGSNICEICIYKDIASQCLNCKHKYENLPDLFRNADAFFEFINPGSDNTSYPDNLYREVEGIPKKEYTSRPRNLQANMDDAINSLESKREQEVLKYRWRMCMTYKQIGKVFDISHERARQIEHNALRKLRYPNRRMVIRYGVTEFCNSESHDELSFVGNSYDELSRTNIIVLDLPVNIYGNLIQAGITTIEEIMHCSREKLLRVHGIGAKNLKKIEFAIRDFASRKESGFGDR